MLQSKRGRVLQRRGSVILVSCLGGEHLFNKANRNVCGLPKDGNGPPIPDSPRGIPLLGDGDGANLSPTGIQMVGKQSPSGLAGTGMGIHPPNPIPANPPRLEHIEVDLMDL